MVERRQHVRLAGEAREAIGVLREGLRQDFDRDFAIELGVGCTPDFAHAALAEFGGDAVMGDALLRAHRARFQAWYHFPAESRGNTEIVNRLAASRRGFR
jgi:hypothetical protein